ncbi:flagellar biosynthetic protein FliO [Fulvimarina sp. MAC8]|uniref:flagellar biosynthetic protein FliO n=1 Tax=Fulvimarina sp. MAC8 TaxID=3162874 RepID=UPI0032EE1C20
MPDWFAAITGDTFGPILWVVFVATLVCLIAVVSLWLIKTMTGGSGSAMGFRGQAPRLAVIEAVNIGDRRRLVLVRRDDEEHLLLLGGASDVVVERYVKSGMKGESRPHTHADKDGPYKD